MKLIRLPFRAKSHILACGADSKGAFALAEGKNAYLVDGFGDLGELDNFSRYEDAVRSFTKKLNIKPRIIACDSHPSYFSSRFAENYPLSAKRCTLYRVQHHEAHIASAIVDNAIKGNVIGVAFDGTGFGPDGNIWGGEFFVGNLKSLKRAAHFEYINMPGGEAAIRQPWRIAFSLLHRVFGRGLFDLDIGFVRRLDRRKCAVLEKMMDKDINSPLTSSVGRLFDAIGSIVFSKMAVTKEAEIPMMLEDEASAACRDTYDFDVDLDCDVSIIRVSKIIKGIVRDLRKGTDRSVIFAKFHNTLANIIAQILRDLRRRFGISKAVLGGGVFQNNYLALRATELLREAGFRVFISSNSGVNDYGIPIGQIGIANQRV